MACWFCQASGKHCMIHIQVSNFIQFFTPFWFNPWYHQDIWFPFSFQASYIRITTSKTYLVRPAKIQISLRRLIRIFAGRIKFWIAKDAKIFHADNESSDQTAQMRRLGWVFIWRTCQKVPFLALRVFFFFLSLSLFTTALLYNVL